MGVVPEHDAFGREIGDDPLAALRGATEPEVRPAEPPEPVARPAEPEPERPVVVAAPRRVRPRRGFVALLVLISLVVAGGAAVPALISVGERIDELVPGPPGAAANPPTGLDGASLIRRGNLERALATLREADLGRLTSLRVAADRIDAALVTGGEKLRSAQVSFDGELLRFGTSAGSFGDGPTIGYGRIDTAAPERLVRRGARRAPRASRRNIDYLVLSPGPPATWGAYFKSGTIVMGDQRGRPTRVL
jgi:hypothetical protein